MKNEATFTIWLLDKSTYIFFVAVFVLFGLLSDSFFTFENFENILVQSSTLAIAATGMTFVLLTGGIDLSIGSIMFLALVIAGKMVVGGYPVWLAFAVILLIGIVYGAVNALCVTKLKILPFIVTLSTLYIGRGLGLLISETRAINLPERFIEIGSYNMLGFIPFPIFFMILVVCVGHFVLTSTPLGRQIYAVGNNQENAMKAGIPTGWVLASVYIISGFCASMAGMVYLVQLGAVPTSLGYEKEFAAIAAAILGGASLFGGRGHVIPGTILGAILIQTVYNGLNLMDANIYVYPLVASVIIFLVVLIDSIRHSQLQQLKRRKIRTETNVPLTEGVTR